MNNKNKSRNYSSNIGKKRQDFNKKKVFNEKTVQVNNNSKNKIKLRPPFSPGLFSYNKPVQIIPQNRTQNSRNIKKNNNFFNSNVFSSQPDYTKISSIDKNYNLTNNMFLSSVNKKTSTKNSLLLSNSTINLNKYKISINDSNKNPSFDSSEKQNINKFINKSINLNINFNYEKDKSNSDKNNNIQIISQYKNFFLTSPKYKTESRRMILEYIKILNKEERNIQKILKENNISEKVLNQKNVIKNKNKMNFNNNSVKFNNKELKNVLAGEAKKNPIMSGLNNSFSAESDNNTNSEENNETYMNILNNKKNSAFNTNNKFTFVNDLNNQKKKKISLLNFLFVPKILNLLESKNKSEKYIFSLVPEVSTYMKGFENYKFIWRNIINNQIENEIDIRYIKECFINERHKNRFVIKVQMNESNKSFFEIETPTNEICEYFTYGINNLMNSINDK